MSRGFPRSNPRRAVGLALLAAVLLLAAGGAAPAAAQTDTFCPAQSFCTATFGDTAYAVIGPCDMSSVSTIIGGCLVVGVGPAPGGSGDPLTVCGVHGCGPGLIVQDGLAPTSALEQEARHQVATLRGVPDDTLNVYWSRGQIRAYMYLRLLQMAYAAPGSLSAQDQQVVDYYRNAINAERVALAQAALSLYHTWKAHPCGFQVPVGDPDAYLAQPGVSGSIADPCRIPPNSPACALGACTPDPPTAEQFTAWAAGQILQSRIDAWAIGLQEEGHVPLTDQEARHAAAIEHALAVGGVHEGMSYLTAVHAAVANVPPAQHTPIEANLEALWLAALKDFAGTQFRDAVVAGAVSTVFFALVSDVVVQGLAATALGAWNNVIGPALAAAAVIAYTTWEQVRNEDVRIQLQAALDDANAGYDLAHYAADTNGRAMIVDALVKSTLPDFLATRLADASDGAAPGHGPAAPSDPVFIQQPSSHPAASFMTEAWDGDFTFTSVRNGWFVQQRDSGAVRYKPSVDYVTGDTLMCDDSGCTFTIGTREHWRAWLHGNEFLAQRIAVSAGLGTVTRTINVCGANAPFLPTGNIDLGNLCVLPVGSSFGFPIQSGDHVVIEGQVREVARVNTDSSGHVTSFSATAPFADVSEAGVPVMVLTPANGNCLTTSSLGARVAGPDCLISPTISTNLGTVTMWTRPTLTITASSVVVGYDDPVPAITPSYAGFAGGDTAASLDTPPTCGTTYTASSFPGTYQTSCSGAVSAKYNIAYVSGTVQVPFAPMTITASSATITYGDPVPAISPSYAGEPSALLRTLPTCTTSYTQGSPPGTYATSCSGATAEVGPLRNCTDPNTGITFACHDPLFAITYVGGTVVVNPAPLTVAASGPAVVYGDPVPAITPTYGGFVNGETTASLTTGATCTTTYTQGAAVGSYRTSCSGAASPNYSISYMPGSLTVTPSPLTVTASSATMIVGGTVPAITASYSGFVAGDSAASLTTPATCSTTATSESAVGTYPSSCSAASSPNYSIAYAGGSVTVTYAINVVVNGPAQPASGGTIPIRVQLRDAGGRNRSSSAIAVTLATPAVSPSPGTAPQPTGPFRLTGPMYLYTLRTIGYPAGRYTLAFTVAGDPVTHTVEFVVR